MQIRWEVYSQGC